MFDFLKKARDRALAELVLLLSNHCQLPRYGTMTHFSIDSEKQEIHCTLELKGEEKPIECRAKFHLAAQPDGTKAMVLDSIWTSREWMNELAAAYLKEEMRRIPIPASAFAILKGLGL